MQVDSYSIGMWKNIYHDFKQSGNFQILQERIYEIDSKCKNFKNKGESQSLNPTFFQCNPINF